MPEDISATNDLLYAGAAVVTEVVGMRKIVSCIRKEPRWKRRLEKQVRELNIDLRRVNTLIQNGKIKRKTILKGETRLETVKEEIKQRISAKVGKIMRYSSRINQYKKQSFPKQSKRFFSQLNGEEEQQQNEAPDAGQAKEFWSAISSKELIISKVQSG